MKDLDDEGRYSFIKGYISDYALVSELVRDTDAVVNFAAETHVDRSISAPEVILQSNVNGVFTLIEYLRKVNPSASMAEIKWQKELKPDLVNRSEKPLKKGVSFEGVLTSLNILMHTH